MATCEELRDKHASYTKGLKLVSGQLATSTLPSLVAKLKISESYLRQQLAELEEQIRRQCS